MWVWNLILSDTCLREVVQLFTGEVTYFRRFTKFIDRAKRHVDHLCLGRTVISFSSPGYLMRFDRYFDPSCFRHRNLIYPVHPILLKSQNAAVVALLASGSVSPVGVRMSLIFVLIIADFY